MAETGNPAEPKARGTGEPFSKPPRSPAIMSGIRIRTETPFGHLHVTVVVDVKTGRECEVFAQLGKCGSLSSADIEAFCRLASLYLRAGGKLEDVAHQLTGIGSHLQTSSGDESQTVPDSLGRALHVYLDKKKKHGLKAIMLGDVPDEEESK